MSVVESTLHKDIGGDIRANGGQIAVGEKYIVQIGSIHGGVVEIVVPEQQPRLKMRPPPVLLQPRPFPDLLDRKSEADTVLTALRANRSVELCGRIGSGKSSLLRYLAYRLPETLYPDGIIFLSAHQQPVADLLQALFYAFYESDFPFKPADTQIRHALKDKKALILLDDLTLSRVEIESLMDIVPGCAFLMATPECCLWGESVTITLGGLPLDDALALIEQTVGRSLTTLERPYAVDICTRLKGRPLHLLQAAAVVQQEGASFESVARRIEKAYPAETLTAQILTALPLPERRVMAVLTALEGASLPIEHDPLVDRLMAAAGDTVSAEFRRRFR